MDKNECVIEVEADKDDFPEGGKGWLVVGGCVCISFSTFGMINSYGCFQTYYETELFPEVSSSKLSIIGACQASIIYCLTPLLLPLVYSFGIRNILSLGATLIIISFFGLSTTKEGELWKCYFFQAVMFSIGSSLLFPPIMFSPIEWFKRRRATALGMSMCGVSLGGMIWPIIFKNMINKYGFGWTTRAIAFVYIPVTIGAIIMIPQTLEPQFIHKEETISNSRYSKAKVQSLSSTYKNLIKSWINQTSDLKYDTMLISNLLGMFGSYPAIFYLDYFATIISPGTTVTTYLLVIFNAMGGPGRVLPGIISDKIGRCNTLIICFCIASISILAMWIPSIKFETISVFAVFVGIFGFFIGPSFSLYPACFAQVFGTNGSEARLGFMLFTSFPGPILGCLIAGSFIPKGSSTDKVLNSFYKLTIYSGTVIFVCGVILLVVRLSITRKPLAFV
uniref:MFS transporter n=1 Tax=Cyberlindnera americana TaxID=36016 RepID=A0A5P8N8I9_9ASCO|nr:MFS transporter [Cyberlindnera americana]